ncbi:MAG: EAL domain-containing protein [Bacilli bacterium]|jgi:EAL domain-containing protein (putative c-di-GMP-specific phosphodiesterase class I)|nr:EAL domain-containing protein [Bacilli bacterium]
MKKSKLPTITALLLVGFVFLGLEVGLAVALALYFGFAVDPFWFYPWLFLIDAGLLLLTGVLVAFLFSRRARLLEEKRNAGESFLNERFVFTEARLKDYLLHKERRHRLKGVLAAIAVKDINSELLSLYGPQRVRSINEICLNCIAWRFGEENECRYAYNMLDGFYVYKDTKSLDAFLDELRGVAADIAAKIKGDESLPSVRILIGVYPFSAGDQAEVGFRRAALAQKFNAESRIDDAAVVYSREMAKRSETQRDLALELVRGLEKEEFEVYYQPKYRLKDKSFYGAEALIRWHHPSRGLLLPSLFIPFAEASGDIAHIDYYVFEHVCRNIAEWKKNGTPILVMSINLSRKTVYNPGLLEFFRRTLSKYDIDPRAIEIELTESIAAKEQIFVADMIAKLRKIGFQTAIDDFGVGYSSLASLKQIPFDTIKIDKSFIDDIEVSEKSRSMVHMVIDLGHSLGMKVVAEGVQSQLQSKILSGFRLDAIQGYFYSHPLSGFDYVRFLAAHKISPNVLEEAPKKEKEPERILTAAEAQANSRANLKRGRDRLPRAELKSLKKAVKEGAANRDSSKTPSIVSVPSPSLEGALGNPALSNNGRTEGDIAAKTPSKRKGPFNPIVNLLDKEGRNPARKGAAKRKRKGDGK